MALSDLKCLRIRLLAVRLSLFWGAGEQRAKGKKKSSPFCLSKKKGMRTA